MRKGGAEERPGDATMSDAPQKGSGAGGREIPFRPANLRTLDTVRGDSLVAFCWSDVRPLVGTVAYLDWRLCGAVSHMVEGGDFLGKAGEVALMPIRGRLGMRRLFVFGLGSVRRNDGASLRRICMQAQEVLEQAACERVTFLAPGSRHRHDLDEAFRKALHSTLPEKKVGPVIDAILYEETVAPAST